LSINNNNKPLALQLHTFTPNMAIHHLSSIRTTVTLALFLPHNAFAAPSPATITYAPGTHSINPDTLNQPGFFILFAFIGAAMVIASVWFFFWAKNGGFVWREGDWDDYKSTVLRRKGPDGRTLTNATKSTKLGGRSVKGGNSIWGKSKWGKSEKGGGRRWDEEDALTEATGWEGEYRDEKADKHKSRKGGRGKGRGQVDEELLAYRAEQPARVGGLNSVPEGNGSHYAYSSTGHTNHSRIPATKIPLSPPTQQPQPKRKSFLTKQREAKAFKRAEKRAKEDIARARKEREEYIYNSKASKVTKTRTTQTHNGPPAPPPHRIRRSSVETVATSTVFSASDVSSISDKKKDVGSSSYYDAYRPDRHSRPHSREPRGDREHHRQRSSSRTRERPSGGRERERENSRSGSHSRTRTSDHGGSRQSSPRKTRSRFPPSSYNGSDISGVSEDGERHAAATTMPRFAHPQVPDLRATAGGYGAPTSTGRRAGGYANRFKDSLSDSEDEDDGDLGGMRGGYGGGGGRKW